MSLLTLEAKLERVDPSTQWGFRMQGGQDFCAPLTIQRVLPGSLAAKCGLQQGDIILKIGNSEANIMKHKDAQGAIMGSGNKLDLLLQRIREKKAKKPTNNFIGKNLEQYMEEESTKSTDQGAPPHQYQYEKFSAPAIPNKAGGLIQFGDSSSNFNTSARPYGAPPPPQAPAPPPAQPSTFQSQINTMTQQTQNITLTPSAAPPQAPPAVAPHSVPSWVPGVSKRPDLPVEIAAERLSEVLQDAPQDLPQIQPLVSQVPEDVVPPELAPMQASPPPAPREPTPPQPEPPMPQVAPPVEAPKPTPPPAAPAPVPWAQSGPKAAAPSPKAFVPKVQPKPPSAPVGPGGGPPRPTGTGAVRGKKGDVTVYQEGQPLPGGARVPICSTCGNSIRGPFVVAMHKTWCPDHFVCAQPRCGVKLLDIGFVEEGGFLYCEKDYETYFAPKCAVCSQPIVGECVNALQKTYHPDCFTCHQCKQAIGGNQFHLEDGHAYCEHDWKQLFQTMCKGCAFPIEPGDRWVEAMSSNYHSECFNCSTCQISLEGQPFYAKAGKPYCKKHAR
ncbi:PDZ and LIM domain protein 7-like isoform X9 [Argopecten irradians]|uniref:PDZ and LIM domain protein 7-like isoform X9 n=1 Tax=Argopecten irradians TaxID=31199 RepID=UPI003721CF74